MERYFILKANDWYMCFVRDTIEELEKFLSSVGANIVKREKIDVVDFGRIYSEEIFTEMDAIGYNAELYNEMMEKINEITSRGNRRANFYESNNIETSVHRICSDVPIKTHLFRIMVSDGEKRTIPNHFFLGDRTFCKFSEIALDDFWFFVRNHAYVDRP